MGKTARLYHYAGIRGHVNMREVLCEHTKRAAILAEPTQPHGPRKRAAACRALRPQLPLPTPRIMHSISQRQGQHSEAPNGEAPVW